MSGTWSITFRKPVTDKFPYYEWNKVREFYLNILDNSPIKERFE